MRRIQPVLHGNYRGFFLWLMWIFETYDFTISFAVVVLVDMFFFLIRSDKNIEAHFTARLPNGVAMTICLLHQCFQGICYKGNVPCMFCLVFLRDVSF